MDSGGAGESYGLVDPRARQILLVAGVAGFVDHAEQSAEQVVFVVAGGDAHILGYAAAERVGADVEAPAVEVKAKDTHRLQAQLPLFSNGERPCGRLASASPASPPPG